MTTIKPLAAALIVSIAQWAQAAPLQASTQDAPQTAKRWDGPLGVQMSLTKKQLEAAGIKLEPNDSAVGYISDSAPIPHKAFVYYEYSIGMKGGLCSIAGYTQEYDSNGAGDQIKVGFSELESALSVKYGTPKQYRSFRYTAKSNDLKNWSESLYKQEVDHMSAWTDSKETPLPHSLKQIVLQAQATGISKGGMRLVYIFKNSDVCTAENLNIRDAPL